MRQRDENQARSGISVAARASFFVEEQKRASEVVASSKTPLNRHPSAKIPPVDKTDTEVILNKTYISCVLMDYSTYFVWIYRLTGL